MPPSGSLILNPVVGLHVRPHVETRSILLQITSLVLLSYISIRASSFEMVR